MKCLFLIGAITLGIGTAAAEDKVVIYPAPAYASLWDGRLGNIQIDRTPLSVQGKVAYGSVYRHGNVILARGGMIVVGPRLISSNVDAIVLTEHDGGACGATPIVVAVYSNGDLRSRPLDVDCHLNLWTVRAGTRRIEFEMRELGAGEADPPSKRIYLLPYGHLFDEKQMKWLK